MAIFIRLCYIGFILLWVIAQDVQQAATTSETAYTLLIVGDSRAAGNTPLFESYRYPLWKKLVEADYAIDFIGPVIDDCAYPSINGQLFDPDHGAIGGAHTTDIIHRLEQGIYPTDADFLLLGIGGNDLLGGDTVATTIENVNCILTTFIAYNPEIVILVEQIAPGTTAMMTPERKTVLQRFNEQLTVLTKDHTSKNHQVFTVNMYREWQDIYLTDDIHYNDAGAKEVAQRYFEALHSFLEK